MHEIGQYRFTEQDAERTVRAGVEIFDLYGVGRDASLIAHLRPALSGAPDDLADDLRRAWAAWTAAGPVLRAAGQLPPRATGTVAHLHAGPGGLPKPAVGRLTIGWSGAEGDRQATRKHHGAPWQALCLWSTEAIDALRALGHPVTPGGAGENITVTGLPWPELRAGVRLRVGTVLCELSAWALPCKQTAHCFADRDFMVMHHDRGPYSRIYATVLEPGTVAVGDAATLEP